jgi:hypothetical protein
MKEANGPRAATGGHPGTPRVAPRFTRAVKAERSRLEDKRAQLLQKREAAQAEVKRIDRAVEATDELLDLLAPLNAADGGNPDAGGQNGAADSDAGGGAISRASTPAKE